jgi:hypothetical protein
MLTLYLESSWGDEMASNGAKTQNLPFLATCGFQIKPRPKYGTYSYINTEKAFPKKNRSGRSLDNFKLSKASNGELWTKWQERVVSEIEM